MKIAEINMLHYGSTGKIMLQIAQCARDSGHEVKTFSVKTFSFQGVELHPDILGHNYVGSYLTRGIHTVVGILTGTNGFFSIAATRKLLRELDAFSPEVIHLHNLHQFCINFPIFFRYIKKKQIRIIWTLHDCWAFTGHCAHFDYIGCEKWKSSCSKCPQYKSYPKSYVDNSKWMYRMKKQWFTGIENMTLVTPSDWLADMVKQSFLAKYPVKVIKNGIDIGVFQPHVSDFRKRYHCEDKKLLLGVAFGWGQRKGIDVFCELATRLDESYQIVLVGIDEATKPQLPDNIIAISRTDSQRELAEIYTAADLLVNPTREEVLGLVNVEALACGTPVITFRSGGSPECVDETCGVVVERDDIDAMQAQIIRICEERPFLPEDCIRRARLFDKNMKFKEYVKLYEGN